jgi:hypothetical protein
MITLILTPQQIDVVEAALVLLELNIRTRPERFKALLNPINGIFDEIDEASKYSVVNPDSI